MKHGIEEEEQCSPGVGTLKAAPEGQAPDFSRTGIIG